MSFAPSPHPKPVPCHLAFWWPWEAWKAKPKKNHTQEVSREEALFLRCSATTPEQRCLSVRAKARSGCAHQLYDPKGGESKNQTFTPEPGIFYHDLPQRELPFFVFDLRRPSPLPTFELLLFLGGEMARSPPLPSSPHTEFRTCR